MRPLEDDDEPAPSGPPRGERIFVGCFAFVTLLIIFIVVVAFAFQRVCACTVHVTATSGRTVDIPDNLDIRLIDYHVERGAAGQGARAGLHYLITHWAISNPGSRPRVLAPILAVSGFHTLSPRRKNVPVPDTLPRAPVPAGAIAHASAAFLIERHAPAQLVYHYANYTVVWPVMH